MFDSDMRTPTRARHQVAAHCARLHPGLDAGSWGTLLLLLTEVVTNAVRHGQAPVEVTFTESGRGVRVEVTDYGADLPAPRLEVALLSDGGRGMMLVERLSSRWGVTPGQDRKTVWFELPPLTG